MEKDKITKVIKCIFFEQVIPKKKEKKKRKCDPKSLIILKLI